MPRTTHTVEVEFDLDPSPGISAITVYAAAEQTAEKEHAVLDCHTGFMYEPSAPPEFDLHTVQVYNHSQRVYRDIRPDEWECLFGSGAWRDLLEFLEGELEEKV